MQLNTVGDLMIPLSECPKVSTDATLEEVFLVLDEAQRSSPIGRPHLRVVLVVDQQGLVVGKLGYLALLRGLEPRYDLFGDLELLARAGVSQELVGSMLEQFRFWRGSLEDIAGRAASIKVSSVMHPIEDYLEHNASIAHGLHRLIMSQTLSLLVKDGSTVVGLFRLAELFTELTAQVRHTKSAKLEEERRP
ncbi:MAG: hypothetical protein A2284_05585 [Deltaproteobacteria bacterium RIFOXYA12_FULL_61_11]|nr:MAG: hypothetical protein A2284_05585 [Deltaproteobacteria bacterium RIFOXYA12_FULL_61_11]